MSESGYFQPRLRREGNGTEAILDGADHSGFCGKQRSAWGKVRRIGTICRGIGISEQSYYRWRREYGGLKLDQAKRLKDLDRENERLKRAVSELTLDKLILKEALEGKY